MNEKTSVLADFARYLAKVHFDSDKKRKNNEIGFRGEVKLVEFYRFDNF